MNKIFSYIVFIFFSTGVFSQISDPVLITNIDSQTDETSGLVFHNGELWTHNDSGGEAALYSIDTTNGSIIRTVSINNASNNDWEDICKDDNYLYIGDIGNNSGARDDLKIYRISLNDLENPETESIEAEIINFAYNPEIYSGKFTNRNNTNFDCEAFIAFGDSLYLFSKNWLDNQSYLYALPKNPGDYIISPRDTLNTNGLVCGADYDESSNTIAMIGYQYGIPAPSLFFILTDFANDDFFSGTFIRKELELNGCQTEAVVFRNSNRLWFTNEQFLTYTQGLYYIDYNIQPVKEFLSDPLFCNIYPNPARNKINITFPCEKRKCKVNVEFININGEKIKEDTFEVSKNNTTFEFDVSNILPGKYMIRIFDKNLYFQTSLIKL
ncbi:MAG: hypothetical protein C0596_07605 [Marinilabiliales bacterium]|nr:MAG: hypothetical protein C0596_07605 [Marinilabiliales bacterium]